MYLKSPLVAKEEVMPLCEAGADEFFCGIEPSFWRKSFKNFSINQRSTQANFTNFKDFERSIQIAHRYKTKVHVAVNAFFYLEEQYKAAYGLIKDILDAGADGIIFADPILLTNMDKRLLKGKDVIVGCDAVIFNSQASLFYKRLGATRIVLPRSMNINEINKIVETDRSMEYEIFIIHDLCFFEDGLCTYCKENTGGLKKVGRGKRKVYLLSSSRPVLRGFGGGCRTPFRRQRVSLKSKRKIGEIENFNFWMKKHIQGCGACAIYDLKREGVTSLKVLDRNLSVEERIKAASFMKKCLDLLKDDGISKGEYIKKCKELFKETFKVKCNLYDCYYPSTFF